MAAGVCWLVMSSCTDCFFAVRGHVVDCDTNAPLAGATISVHIDRGIHGPRTLPATFTTDAAGQFKVTTDGAESCDTSATLTYQKDGYMAVEAPIEGSPKNDVQQCLTAVAPP